MITRNRNAKFRFSRRVEVLAHSFGDYLKAPCPGSIESDDEHLLSLDVGAHLRLKLQQMFAGPGGEVAIIDLEFSQGNDDHNIVESTGSSASELEL